MATPPRFLFRTISLAVAAPSPLDAGAWSGGSPRPLLDRPPSAQNSHLPITHPPTTACAISQTPRTLDSPRYSSKSPPPSQSSTAADNPEKYAPDPPLLPRYQSRSQSLGQSYGLIPPPVLATRPVALLSDTWGPTLHDTSSRRPHDSCVCLPWRSSNTDPPTAGGVFFSPPRAGGARPVFF